MLNDGHRIGFNQNNERPRRILVTFANHQDKINILKAWQIVRNFPTKYIGVQSDVLIYRGENLNHKRQQTIQRR